MPSLPEMLSDAVKQSVGLAIATQVGDIAAKETRLALQQHEADLTALVRHAVSQAINELFAKAALRETDEA